LRAIEVALRKAWDELHDDYDAAQRLSHENEVRISHLLRERLNDIREREGRGGVDDYSCALFERPQIGAEIQTPEGKIRKPDIVFGLCGKRRPGVTNGMTDCIFVECKILDQKKNLRLYCRDGLQRFVTGAYSAWMREAMMVAYVRTQQSLPQGLESLTETSEMQDLLASTGKLASCNLTRIDPRVYISVHERHWRYPDEQGRPGPIEIRHLWLRV
jgi:hypothetical protein